MSAVEDSLETQARIGALRCEGGPHSPTGHLLRQLADEIERLRAEVASLNKDAERYRWLRLRLEVRDERALSGRTRPAICTRVGQSFLDTETRGAKGYTDPNKFAKECDELDAAIDAALKEGS